MPDALPGTPKPQRESKTLATINPAEATDARQDRPCLELNIDNLLAVLDQYGVKHKEIVAAQAILETGNFTSSLCLQSHNLFGLRHPSDGSYYEFNTWEESVLAYRDDVQYKYSGGDYYAFLRRIGYAEDRRYTTKVKRIRQRMDDATKAAATLAQNTPDTTAGGGTAAVALAPTISAIN